MASAVAVPWWIATTGGAKDLAIYGITLAIVSLLLAPVLSPFGDRFSKRSQIVFGQTALTVPALMLALLASTHQYHIGLLIVAGVMMLMARTFVDASQMTIPVELEPAEHLPRAIGLQKLVQSMGRLAGPAIAGGVLAAGGTAATLWLYFLLTLLSATVARGIPPSRTSARRAGGFAKWKTDMRAGLIAKWTVPLERGWTLVNFLVWIFIGPGFTMFMALKVKSLNLSGGWLGACEAALSIGMLAGALGLSDRLVQRFGRYHIRIWAAATEGIALALAGQVSSPYILLCAFWIAGVANTSMSLVGVTHRALAVPPDFRVRLTAVSQMCTQIANMIGPAIAGIALLHWPVSTVYTAFGLSAMVFAFGFLLVPRSREFFGLSHEDVRDWYRTQYPSAFPESAPPTQTPAAQAS
ncbi:MAG: MFS transporter [Burkholderiales bacterium]|nr:MFS transporter [Burkholderiales bacterium]